MVGSFFKVYKIEYITTKAKEKPMWRCVIKPLLTIILFESQENFPLLLRKLLGLGLFSESKKKILIDQERSTHVPIQKAKEWKASERRPITARWRCGEGVVIATCTLTRYLSWWQDVSNLKQPSGSIFSYHASSLHTSQLPCIPLQILPCTGSAQQWWELPRNFLCAAFARPVGIAQSFCKKSSRQLQFVCDCNGLWRLIINIWK